MSDIKKIVCKHQDPDGRVFAVLEEIQKKYNYIPKEALKEAAERLNLPLTQLYGVVTFYAGFSLEPKGQHVISICHGTVCHVKGSKILADALEQELHIKEGETTPDGKFTLQPVRCLGCCSLAPVVAIDDQIYGNLNREKLLKLIRLYREGKEVEKLAAASK